MAIIVNRVSEKVMSISNEQIARTISIGSDWSWIRVGVLYELFSSSAAHASIPGPELAIGLSSGTGSLYYDSSLKHFLGVRTDPSKTYTSYGNGPAFWAPIGANGLFFTEKTSSQTEVSRSGYPASLSAFSTGSVRSRTILNIDFIKSSSDPGTWNLISYTVSAGNGNISPIDFAPADLYFTMSVQTQSFTNYARNTATWPVSESYRGMLDTVNISWNLTQSCEISDVAVYRFR